jgi:hypothetical protein
LGGDPGPSQRAHDLRESAMRKMIAAAFAAATLLLLVPSMAAGAFYGTPTGKAKKECQAAGGTWITYKQICQLP